MAKDKNRPEHRVVRKDVHTEIDPANMVEDPASSQEKPQGGRVLAVGPGKLLDAGARALIGVAEGDEVLFGKYSGAEITLDGTQFTILRESSIVAVGFRETGEIVGKPTTSASSEHSEALGCLQSALTSAIEGRLRMSESYEGVVEEVDGDRVLVVYDVDGKIVEQTYDKSQFIGGQLPEVGTQLAVFVNVVEVQPRRGDSQPDVEGPEPRDEFATCQRKPLSGIVEF